MTGTAKSAIAVVLIAIAGAVGITAGDGGEEAPSGAETTIEGIEPPETAPAGESPSDAVADDERAAIAVTLALIESGQPLPYDEDGQTFQNREGRLPDQPIGYYREYTVETPGSPDRGARRLVIGAGGETYYTNDHYGSFIEIDPEDYL